MAATSEDTQRIRELLVQLSHHCTPAAPAPSQQHSTSKARELAGDNILYEYAEHRYLGDNVTLLDHSDKTLTLGNGVKLTYGEINGLAGDLFGTDKPICMGNDPADREQRFRDAYQTLAGPNSDAKSLIGKLSNEVKSLEEAAKNHATFTENFEPTAWYKLWWATRSRDNVPSFLDLGKINADHFGDDAGTAYNAGHRVALQHAAKGSTSANPNLTHDERKQYLQTAYTMNAFADHFLEDRFASGHLRTPRRHLMGGTGKNLCAKMMHDEDNNNGLTVRSPDRSDEWKVYGDGNLLREGNEVAVEQCLKALNASAKEVHEAWLSGVVPASDYAFSAWAHAPTLESANGPNNHAPMFNKDGRVRDPLKGPGPYTYKEVESYGLIVASQAVDKADAYAGTTGWHNASWEAKAGADFAVWEKKSYDGSTEFLGGGASVAAGTYVGADAGIHAVKYETEGAKIKIGLGVDTGAGLRDGSLEAKFLGTGFSFGRETGISFLGSEFKCKFW